MNKLKEVAIFIGLFGVFYVLFNWNDLTSFETVEDVCNETSKILYENNGQGFTDVAYLGCLDLGLEEAKQDQEAIIELIENR
ncbi:MAG: hypothetical protein ACPG5R_04215 [Cognaticolwellia aestuarii]